MLRSYKSYLQYKIGDKGILSLISSVARERFNVNTLEFPVLVKRFQYKFLSKPVPKIIQIQTITNCNYSCSFCPIGKIEIEEGVMSDEQFDSILDQLKDYTGIIKPYLMNEPLLDPRLLEFCKKIRKRTKASVLIQTNGSKLDRETLIQLSRYSKVVINDYTKSKKIYNKFSEFKKWKNIILIKRNENAKLTNRAGNLPDRITVKKDLFCVRPFEQMYINYKGELTLCCQDWSFEEIMGNLGNSNLMEVWRNNAYKQKRQLLLENKREGLCSKCDFSGV